MVRTEKELGPVTILVNNAGVSWRGTLDTYDPEQATRMRQVNVEGLIDATRAVIGGMRARRYGRIVNISSIAAIGTALPGNAFYAITKSEVAILTKRFAMELGPHNITVNAVAPGFVRTDMTQRGRGAGDWQGTEEVCRQGNDGPYWRTGRHCQCGRLLSLAKIWRDHGTDANRGRWTDGLHWTCVVVVSASALDAWVCAPSILPEQTFRHVIFPRESRVLPRQFASHQNPRKLPQAFFGYTDFGFASVHPWHIQSAWACTLGGSIIRRASAFGAYRSILLGAHLAN